MRPWRRLHAWSSIDQDLCAKVLDAAARFYVETLGAELRYRSTVRGCDYRLLRLGDARIILFERAPYEHLLEEPVPPGLLHTVYEVDDQVNRRRESGCRIIMGPTEIESDFGLRRICFFVGPGGARTEVMQILRDSGLN